MRLDTYLENRNISYAEFAETLGVTRNAVMYWCRGLRRPSVENTLAIEEATDRHVTARDLIAMVLHGDEL